MADPVDVNDADGQPLVRIHETLETPLPIGDPDRLAIGDAA